MLGIVIAIIGTTISIVLVGIQLLSLRKSVDTLTERLCETKQG